MRGPKRKAKTDRADARHERVMLAAGQLPECWIPPSRVLDLRALLETYLDLRKERTGWIQRVHAVLYHHGTPSLSGQRLGTPAGQAALAAAAARCSPAAGQVQVQIAVEIAEALDQRLLQVRRQLVTAARHTAGARELQARLYGAGPVTALALTCWLGGAGRFSSSRQAVRFAGLDITVHSSDAKRSPGHLSRQGPAVLRWAVFESGKAHARRGAPHYAYYTQVKDRVDGKRAALSVARKILREAHHILAALGDDALAPC